jgi:hypothetical protein
MTHLRFIALTAAFYMMLLTVSAQQYRHMDQKREEIQAEKVAFITQQLRLTPQEAEKFWPVYNEFDEQRKQYEKGQMEQYHGDVPDLYLMTDEEVDSIMLSKLDRERKMVDLRAEYYVKFKEVLPVKKVFLLHKAEMDFKRILLDRIREDGYRNPPPKE